MSNIDEQIARLTAIKITQTAKSADGLPIELSKSYYYIYFENIREVIATKENLRSQGISEGGVLRYFGELFSSREIAINRLIAMQVRMLKEAESWVERAKRKLKKTQNL